jgi:hypothetical protein
MKLATYFFSRIISLIIVLMTPTFPFRAPPIIRKIKACQKVVEKPNPTDEIMVPISPIKRILLRPLLSDQRPHNIAVHSWAAANAPCITPAWEAMTESGRVLSKDLSW